MSEINYQALREAAQNAKDLGGIKNYKRGEQAVAEFESLITPHIVLALLDERERNQQYIKRRDQENEEMRLRLGSCVLSLKQQRTTLLIVNAMLLNWKKLYAISRRYLKPQKSATQNYKARMHTSATGTKNWTY